MVGFAVVQVCARDTRGVDGFAALADPHEPGLACCDEPVSGGQPRDDVASIARAVPDLAVRRSLVHGGDQAPTGSQNPCGLGDHGLGVRDQVQKPDHCDGVDGGIGLREPGRVHTDRGSGLADLHVAEYLDDPVADRHLVTARHQSAADDAGSAGDVEQRARLGH